MNKLIFGVFILCYSMMLCSQELTHRNLPFSKVKALKLAATNQNVNRLIVKFKEGTGVRASNNKLISKFHLNRIDSQQLSNVQNILLRENLEFRSLFDFNSDDLDNLNGLITNYSKKSIGDFNAYIMVDLISAKGSEYLNLIREINRNEIVEVAYLETPDSAGLSFDLDYDDFINSGSTPLMINHQKYFYPAPIGVGLFSVWNKLGAKGEGVKIMVYDNAYRKTHEDIPDLFYSSGVNPVQESHGTAVLGILGAKNNGIGFTGGVYESKIGFQQSATGFASHANMLLKASNQLEVGDVLLIEVGKKVDSLSFECPCNPTQANSVPLEFYPAEFDVINALVASGIIVVQAAGNGCVDFNSPVFSGQFDKINSTESIWVTAGSSEFRGPTCYSNYGDRVDFNSWGDSVVALLALRKGEVPIFDKGLDRLYGPNFGGSSAAAPIVASCIVSLQGQEVVKSGMTLNISEIKSKLMASGQTQEIDLDRPIGPMPDMENIPF